MRLALSAQEAKMVLSCKRTQRKYLGSPAAVNVKATVSSMSITHWTATIHPPDAFSHPRRLSALDPDWAGRLRQTGWEPQAANASPSPGNASTIAVAVVS
ncbi:hypothetical protein, partial [Mesorhizobium sp. M7A.F.Ca.US.001.04.2.1]|uniref:hypothetical protein n=1 Tax=Mesorhizobium sp. M7A.F.Ca.US.001.04.2.1 TaxID=2496727 RepID=UPI0019CF69EB